ncbi:MAG TPA: hypothetical protein VFK47_19720 [Ktedonobacteraceae bacterium]|nr:hypothetical protein [Ktedonobacteraceae bacterium]
MAVRTIVHVYTKDAQGYTEDNHFDVEPAAFGATTLPTAAHIEAYINSVYGTTDLLSTSIVTGYSVEVLQDNPTASAGGNGAVATSIALKTRQEIGVDVSDPDGWEIRLPGADKATYSFDPTNANSVVVSSPLWDTVRTALLALKAITRGDLTPTDKSAYIQTAVVFNGRRGAKRPR